MKRTVFILSASILLLTACTPAATPTPLEQPVPTVVPPTAVPPTATPEPVELQVFAASSLTDALTEVATAFQTANPNVTVVTNFGSSSQLATQINEGAQADVFASANNAQMTVVSDAGNIDGDSVVFVTNRLVVIVPKDNPAAIQTLADLAKPGLRLVLAAPGVPIRDYSDQMIAALSANADYGDAFDDAVYANLVSEEENVRQVSAKVSLGEADAGIVYSSDITPDIADTVLKIDVPDEFNVLASYPVAKVAGSAHPDVAQAFIDFLLSDEGQAIFAKWGFGPKQ